MRRLLLAAALIAGCGVLFQPIPAEAGGPTSVLVTNQALGRAAAFTISDSRYAQLEQALADTTPVKSPAAFPNGDWLAMTWLMHDIHVWRTHQLLLDADGGPLVAITNHDDDAGPEPETWARIDDGPALKALLTEFGMIGKVRPSGVSVAEPDAAGAITGDQSTSQPDTATAVETATEPASSWFTLSGWRWAVPGLLGGLLLGLAYLPTRRLVSRRSGPPGERHQLIDMS